MKIVDIVYGDDYDRYGDRTYIVKPFKNREKTIKIEMDRWSKNTVKQAVKRERFYSNPKIHMHQFSDINAPLSENTVEFYCDCGNYASEEVECLLKVNNIHYRVTETLMGFEGIKMFRILENELVLFSYNPDTLIRKWKDKSGLYKGVLGSIVIEGEDKFILDCKLYSRDDIKNLNKICRSSYMRYTSKLMRKFGKKYFKSKYKVFQNAPRKYRRYLKNSEQYSCNHLSIPSGNIRSDKLNLSLNWYALFRKN